jgi:LysR family glycine cleavage system transcriptional activator
MTINMNRIPAPNTLIVFEASARHLSFTKAASELNLTQAAVSKQIIQLEARLRVPLFVRAHRTLLLTPQGKALYQTVFKSLGDIAATVAEIKSLSGKLVTLASTAAFATLWVLPRLHSFRQAHPDIDLRFLAGERNAGPLPDSTDLVVCYGNAGSADVHGVLLCSVDIFPVCSPAFQAQHALRQGEDLAGVPLLELTTDHWQGMDWELWLKEAGLETTQLHIPCFFNDYVMLQRAAESGLGVGLGWSPLCDEALQAGRLVAPLRNKVAVSPGSGYYLSALTQQARPEVQAVQAWLLQQAKNPLP